MAKIINVNDYQKGFTQGFEDGRAEGYTAGYEAAQAEFEPRLAKLVVELLELNARISVLDRKIQ